MLKFVVVPTQGGHRHQLFGLRLEERGSGRCPATWV